MLPDRDPVTDLLRVVRVNGAILLHDTYPTPWAVLVPAADVLAEIVGVARRHRVVAFHHVERGHLDLSGADGSRYHLDPGDLVVAIGGAPHLLGRGGTVIPQSLAHHLTDRTTQRPRLEPGQANQDTTGLLCGVLVLEYWDTALMTHRLPSFIRLPAGSAPLTPHLVARLLHETNQPAPGSGAVQVRLLELLLADALRHVLTQHPHPASIEAAGDPVVWDAVEAVLADPARAWDVPTLATLSASSPSQLTLRFRRALGLTPMAFVAATRLDQAGKLLERSDLSVERVALEVGYSNQPAFTRAFRRHHGTTPNRWRHQAGEQVQPPIVRAQNSTGTGMTRPVRGT